MQVSSSNRSLQPHPRIKALQKGIKTLRAAGGKPLDASIQAASAASDAVHKSDILSGSLTAAGSVARSFQAFPNFVYPSIHNATAAEKAQIMTTLDSLPLKHVADTKSISMVAEIPNPKPGYVTNGNARHLVVSNQINLSRAELTTPEKLRGTLTHEIGHTTDFSSKSFGVLPGRSNGEPYGEGPYITNYAETNHYEDFADSYEEYHIRPDNLREKTPEKFADMEEFNKQSFLERLVDRKEFRDTGKYLAEVVGPNRAVRHGVQGAYHASTILQLSHGFTQWVNSAETGDAMSHASGILNTASGILFLSGLSPLAGMAVHGANYALNSAVKRERLNAKEVEAVISKPVRPLEALFGRDNVPIESQHRVGKVAATAVGGALGGAAGALVGPYVGVLAGHAIAGGAGGAVGMVVGGLAGFIGGAELGGRLGGGLAGLAGGPDPNSKPSFLEE